MGARVLGDDGTEGPSDTNTGVIDVRILQVITDDTRRGAQLFALDLHDAMECQGVDVTTVALASETPNGLSVDALGSTRRSLRTAVALRRAAKNADVVVAHGSTTLIVCVLATTGLRAPVIYRQISDSVFWAPTWRRRIRVALFLRRTARVVALAEQSKQTLIEYFGLRSDHVSVIPNGVPPKSFPPPSVEQRVSARDEFGVGGTFCVAYVGALVPEKGVDVAIESVAGMSDATLIVAGEGDQRVSLEAFGRRIGADVRFLGSVDRPIDVLHAADVLVLPSKGGDSMPAVLIEAAFAALPTIATSVGAIPDVIESGRTGIIIQHANARSLSEALVYLRDAAEVRVLMGQQARARAMERFDIEVVAASWLVTCADVAASYASDDIPKPR